ncbi:hypothetical protein C8R46DRAFT_1133436 [Mycena filopes]|nr:hypothetical protein C8R46DRAFT_1133436 [Mycena filopes]
MSSTNRDPQNLLALLDPNIPLEDLLIAIHWCMHNFKEPEGLNLDPEASGTTRFHCLARFLRARDDAETDRIDVALAAANASLDLALEAVTSGPWTGEVGEGQRAYTGGHGDDKTALLTTESKSPKESVAARGGSEEVLDSDSTDSDSEYTAWMAGQGQRGKAASSVQDRAGGTARAQTIGSAGM